MSQKGTTKRRWTEEDKALMRLWGPTMQTKEIARRLGRSHQAVRSRAWILGIPMRYSFKYLGNTRSPENQLASRSPTIRDLEWAAGFLEGEGAFTNTGTTERMEAKQVQREPLDRLCAMFGGRIYHNDMTYQRAQGGKANDSWSWSVGGARARGVMLTLYDLLSTKRREQIAKALSKCRRN